MTGTGKTNVAQLLRNSVLCRDLPEDALAALAGRVRHVRHAADECIVRQGEAGDALMIVVSGRAKIVTYSAAGGEVMHNTIEPGMVLGELSILDGQPRSADAVAMVPTEVLVLSRSLLLETLERYPKVAMRMMAVLSAKLRRATTLYEETLFLSLPARLLRLLHLLAHECGKRAGQSVVIQHGMSQDELAGRLGVTRESINRQLGAWKASGLVEVSRGCVVVHNMDALTVEVDHFSY